MSRAADAGLLALERAVARRAAGLVGALGSGGRIADVGELVAGHGGTLSCLAARHQIRKRAVAGGGPETSSVTCVGAHLLVFAEQIAAHCDLLTAQGAAVVGERTVGMTRAFGEARADRAPGVIDAHDPPTGWRRLAGVHVGVRLRAAGIRARAGGVHVGASPRSARPARCDFMAVDAIAGKDETERNHQPETHVAENIHDPSPLNRDA